MKYYGAWSAGTTRTYVAYESTNKNKLIKEMTKMAYGNCHGVSGNCYWQVWCVDENGDKKRVAHGGKPGYGKKWREDFR